MNVINIIAHNPKAAFLSPLSFEIFFEALQPLRRTLTWRILYIGQASDSTQDQVLEEAEMEDIQPGQMKFVFEGGPPDVSKIQESEVVGVTGVLVTCSYNAEEFFRVGYYVNNYYEEPELQENPPDKPLIDRLTRHILVEKPRVTKFQVQWDDSASQTAASLIAQGLMPNESELNQLNMMHHQQQQQMAQEGCLQAGSQFKDRNDMMSHANLQAVAGFFGGAPQ